MNNGYDLQSFLKRELSYKYAKLAMWVDYYETPYRHLNIVFYNADKRFPDSVVCESGNIALVMTGFGKDNKVLNDLSVSCAKSKEIESLMRWKDNRGNVTKVSKYILDKFKNLDLNKVTCSTKHLKLKKDLTNK